MMGTAPMVEAVARLVGRHAGLCFAANGKDRLEGAARRCMRKAGFASERHYLDHLASESGALNELVEEVVVGETYLFRDQRQFAFIRNDIVPEILSRKSKDHVIRAWSAGCASGEEAYSLAILFDQEGLSGQSAVVGTDISRRALAKARAARFGCWSFRGVDDRFARAYFSPDGAGWWKLGDRLRTAVRFEYVNLAQDTYPSPTLGLWALDLVLCRNTLIYLDDAAVAQAFRRIWESLAPGGWLVLGAADPSPFPHAPFVPVVTPDGLFYRRAAGAEPLRRPLAAPALTPAPPPSLPCVAIRPSLGPVRADDGDPLRTVRSAAEEACVLQVRAAANLGREREAARLATQAAVVHPFSAELHLLGAVLLMGLGRAPEAADAVRKALYIDRRLAVGHFLLGRLLGSLGDAEGAGRSFRNVQALCSTLAPDTLLPFGDGERAGALAAAAASEVALLEQAGGRVS